MIVSNHFIKDPTGHVLKLHKKFEYFSHSSGFKETDVTL